VTVALGSLLAWSPVRAKVGQEPTCPYKPLPPPSTTIADVAVGKGKLLAVGWVTTDKGDKDGAVWTSALEAPSPTPVEEPEAVFGGSGDQYVNAVIPYGTGFLAVGSDNSHAAVWTSTNGREWDRQALGQVAGEQSSMRAVVEAADMLVVGGWVCLGDASGRQPAVWTAEHGLDWSKTELPTHAAFALDPASPQAQVNDVAVVGSRLIAAGTVRTEPLPGRKVNWDAAVWSRGGASDRWEVVHEIDGDDGPGDQYINSVTAWPGGMVAVGGEGFLKGTNPAMWFSSNGQHWERRPQRFELDYQTLWEAQTVWSVTAVGDTLIAAGSTLVLARNLQRARIWSSINGRDWVPMQTNELPSEARSVESLSGEGGNSAIVVGWRQGPLDSQDKAAWIQAPLTIPAALAGK
jgi:hypothetical protein